MESRRSHRCGSQILEVIRMNMCARAARALVTRFGKLLIMGTMVGTGLLALPVAASADSTAPLLQLGEVACLNGYGGYYSDATGVQAGFPIQIVGFMMETD